MTRPNWDPSWINDFLTANTQYEDFVNGKNAGIVYTYNGIEFLVYRHLETIKLYFLAPYLPENDYDTIMSLFEAIKPHLNKEAQLAADKRTFNY